MSLGGSDPFGAAEVLARLAVDAVDPLDLRVVSPEPAPGARVLALRRGHRQSVEILTPRPDLLSTARGADVVVTASGSSVWESMLHGVPFACVQVADNQQPGYRALLDREAVRRAGLVGLPAAGAGRPRARPDSARRPGRGARAAGDPRGGRPRSARRSWPRQGG